MTEQAYNDIEFPKEFNIVNGEETYDEIGTIKTRIYLPHDEEQLYIKITEKHNYSSIFFKMKNSMMKIYQSMFIKVGLKKLPAFHNLPDSYDTNINNHNK